MVLTFFVVVIGVLFTLFFFYPRGLSLILSYRKECKVMRVEPFMKGMIMTGPGQMNKFSVACDNGFICRAEDSGFAAVKTGDTIEFRGFPEFSTWEEFGKCDHAQLVKIISESTPSK
jgi:hypothetical protein